MPQLNFMMTDEQSTLDNSCSAAVYSTGVTYRSHIICEVDIMIPYQIGKGISQPDHINIIVHHTVSKLQNV